ncbi:MAG TPA: hypothetical protein VFU23_11000 [Gemmatimonadales bacterium]|nr:hypothetical protein [Gemmatimonadales bacterium]
MISWIAGLIGQVSGGLAAVTRDVIKKLQAIWNNVTGFFGLVKAVLVWLRALVVGWILATGLWLASTYTTVKWIITTLVPQIVATAITNLRKALLVLIDLARTYARQIVDSLRRWAFDAIGKLITWVASLARWVNDKLGPIFNDLRRLKDRVFGVLASATRIVDYILGPLVSALERYALANAERFARWLWRGLPRILLGAASLIESIVARII